MITVMVAIITKVITTKIKSLSLLLTLALPIVYSYSHHHALDDEEP